MLSRATRSFWNRNKAAPTNDLVKFAKDPKLFQAYAEQQQLDKDNEKYKERLQKMKGVAESRKNMRIDMRPAVVARTMTLELMLGCISLFAAASLPLYFLKVRPILEEYRMEGERQKVKKEMELEKRERK